MNENKAYELKKRLWPEIKLEYRKDENALVTIVATLGKLTWIEHGICGDECALCEDVARDEIINQVFVREGLGEFIL